MQGELILSFLSRAHFGRAMPSREGSLQSQKLSLLERMAEKNVHLNVDYVLSLVCLHK